MTEITENAYAKLNLSLDVTGRRPDGYHDMVMVMQTVSLCDRVTIRKTGGGAVFARSNLPFIPSDERNLAVRAALRYLEAIGERGQGLSIRLEKQIPVGAGMAGGSSDAAAVLRGLNGLYKGRLSREKLLELAAGVGSDVAFCVLGGTALAKGRGELLKPLPPLPDCCFAVCKPDFSVSTPELFRKLDSVQLRRHPDTAGILRALETGRLDELCHRLYNVFEDVDDRRLRVIQEIKGRLLDFGALGALMTGTGSAVFGVFERQEAAQAACGALEREFGFCRLAKPVGALLPSGQPEGETP